MSDIIANPLSFLSIQTGRTDTPLEETGAVGASNLDYAQRAAKIGEPVPIVFGRWRDGAGGCFISPGATDCRFENDSVTNDVTAYYHFILSQGVIDPIRVSDVFQRICRVGSHTQAYDRRAAAWTPGNFIVGVSGKKTPEASQYCGSIGYYPNMSTMSFIVTVPDGFDSWNRQVHVFIRGGMHVNRLLEGSFGPSDNFADLVQWLLIEGVKMPTLQVDSFRMQIVAEFLQVNGFTCNCVIDKSTNYSELVNKWAPYFLVTETNNGGEKSLRPLLPINEDGTIKVTPISPEYMFTEDEILPDSFEIDYVDYASSRPFVAQMVWRQQLEADIGIIRTNEVRFAGTASSGPYESHDLSQFCTREDHAVKAGAYLVSKRVRSTHMIRFAARPGLHNRIVTPGSIVWVALARRASGSAPAYHSYFYQVERITKTLEGDVGYECSHFPIDNQFRSLIALDVVGAEGSGILYSITKTGVTCDINDEDDDTIPDPPPPSPPPDQPLPPPDIIGPPGLDYPPPPGVDGTPPPGGPGSPGDPIDRPADKPPGNEPDGPLPPGFPPSGWPEGPWSPSGYNKWTFNVTERISHGWGDTEYPLYGCHNGRPLGDIAAVVRLGPGKFAFAGATPYGIGPCDGVKQYGATFVYVSEITNIYGAIGYTWARTGGLRSYTLTASVEPLDPDADDIEDFPDLPDFIDRYL